MDRRKGSRTSLPVHDFRMPFANLIPFEISSFSEMPDEAWANFPHRHNFYEIVYLTQDQGHHIIDFETYPVHADSLYFISPRQIHFWQINVSLKGWLVFFTDDFLSYAPSGATFSELAFFSNSEHRPYLKLEENQRQVIVPVIENLEAEYLTHKSEHASILRAYLHILLIKVQLFSDAIGDGEESQSTSHLVRRFKQLVMRELGTRRSVRSLAEQLGITAGHLSETVKVATVCTPGQIIRQTLTMEAKRLLANTDLTVSQIAYSLDFEDPFYFTRVFKRETGMSPCRFRERIREKYSLFHN